MTGKSDNPFHQWVQLEQPRLGSRVVFATDDFFAAKERLIQPSEPEFIPDKYDDHGKWMDGWESRRKRTPGHDHCIIRLGIPGVVHGIDIDTRHFTGNYPPEASLEACRSDEDEPAADTGWTELLPRSPIGGDAHHYFEIGDDRAWTHLRLHIYPDGGVARLRVFGEVRPDWSDASDDEVLDLVALENGGRALCCNDEHFGSMHNLNVPGRGINMGDGWETARRRVPGNDWVILALGHPGIVERVEIDTAHFKGNYPDRAAIQAAMADDADLRNIEAASRSWAVLLPECKLKMDQQHFFEQDLNPVGPVSHVRLSIFPDGGISRLRLFGRLARG
ncbi:MAG: allantoicase [Gammaproteobacteria bacterium]|nr:allantoicase [Gammaproteobacteria bacterium]